MLLLECISFVIFLFDEVKSQPQITLSLLSEIQKTIWILQLVQIPLNIVVIVNVFLELGAPLPALLIVHEELTVHIVEVDSHLGSVGVGLTGVRLRLILHVKIKPEPLDFN